jgi:hypothetical protein
LVTGTGSERRGAPAATGAGAFSLSENGLYTLEGWRAFLKAINDDGVFTVSRWYSPGDVNETGRMVSLATAALLDAGVKDPRQHLFVARAELIATLVLSKAPFSAEKLGVLEKAVADLGFNVLLAPNHPPETKLLQSITDPLGRVTKSIENYIDGTPSERPDHHRQGGRSRPRPAADDF